MIRLNYARLIFFACALFVIFSTVSAFAEESQSAQTNDSLQAPAAPADQPKNDKRRLTILPAVNVYFPSDSKTTNRFGDSWTSLGFALAYQSENMDPRKIELRLDGMAQNSNTTSAYIFPIGMGINTILSSSKTATTYAGITANAYIAKLESVPDNVDTGWKIKPGASALIGANIGSKFNVQASYYFVPKLGGFDLSGLNVSAHIRLIQF